MGSRGKGGREAGIGGELRGEGDLPASPSLRVENLEGDSDGLEAGTTYGENLADLAEAELSTGDLGDKVGSEVREAAARKGGEVVRGEAEPVLEVLTMAARSAGL